MGEQQQQQLPKRSAAKLASSADSPKAVNVMEQILRSMEKPTAAQPTASSADEDEEENDERAKTTAAPTRGAPAGAHRNSTLILIFCIIC